MSGPVLPPAFLAAIRAADRVLWQPFQELMTGTPPGPGAELHA